MQNYENLLSKVESLLIHFNDDSTVECLKTNKALIGEICSISETHPLYNASVKKREAFIEAVTTQFKEKDSCLAFAWHHCLEKLNDTPSLFLVAVIVVTMPVVQHFLKD